MIELKIFDEIQEYGYVFYELRDKFSLYVLSKSLKAFKRADKRRNKIKTKEEFQKYSMLSKKKFMESIGGIPYNKNLPLESKITNSCVCDGIKIENIIFRSRENVYVTGNFYIPEKAEGKLPAVLLQCGHSAQGRLLDKYVNVCMTIAKAGIAVFAIDPLGQGERKSYPELFSENTSPVREHQHCGNQCILSGESLTKYFLADAMRAVDYMVSREDVDAERIGATGSSGGGTMTAVLGVVDERIKAVAPGTFITTREDYMYAGGPQDAEQIWHGASKNNFDHYELISCFCPKPYLILGVKSDFFCREGTEKVYNKEKEFYALFGSENNIRIKWDDSTHAYTGKLALHAAEFFSEFLCGKKIKAESPKCIPAAEELRCTKSGQLLSDGVGGLPVFEDNKKEFLKKKIKNSGKILIKNIYNNREICELNVRHLGEIPFDGFNAEKILWFSQKHMMCYGVLLKPDKTISENFSVTVCLWDGGTDKIFENYDPVKDILSKGGSVLVADLTAMGKCAPFEIDIKTGDFGILNKLNSDLIFLGDSLCQIRAFDLIRTFEMLKTEYGIKDINLYTVGNFSIYADILKKTGINIFSECKKPINISDLITNKIYDKEDISNISMYGIGMYLK